MRFNEYPSSHDQLSRSNMPGKESSSSALRVPSTPVASPPYICWAAKGSSNVTGPGSAGGICLLAIEDGGLSRAGVARLDAKRCGDWFPRRRGNSSLIISSIMRTIERWTIRDRICGRCPLMASAEASDTRVGGRLGRSTRGTSRARSSKTSRRQSALGQRSAIMARMFEHALKASDTSGES